MKNPIENAHAKRRLQTVFLLSFSVLLFQAETADASGECGDKVQINCTSDGQAHAMIKGARVPVNCGASTRSKTGQISPPGRCTGVLSNGVRTCLVGAKCLLMDGAKKMHMTTCGRGAIPATGAMNTRGCVVFSKPDFEKLWRCQGTPFEVVAGRTTNGRGEPRRR